MYNEAESMDKLSMALGTGTRVAACMVNVAKHHRSATPSDWFTTKHMPADLVEKVAAYEGDIAISEPHHTIIMWSMAVNEFQRERPSKTPTWAANKEALLPVEDKIEAYLELKRDERFYTGEKYLCAGLDTVSPMSFRFHNYKHMLGCYGKSCYTAHKLGAITTEEFASRVKTVVTGHPKSIGFFGNPQVRDLFEEWLIETAHFDGRMKALEGVIELPKSLQQP